ncbi:MAG: HTTM domain-containing protein, partial [Acidimicrobiia bacterium]
MAWLVYLRIGFGTLMVWETWRYLANGWVTRYYQQPSFFFTYWPFDVVRPWPGEWMTWHFLAMGLAAFFVAIGFCYRISAPALFLLFTYVFLLDKARYLNHFYLVSLVAFVMTVLPAHRAFSVDALLHPRLRVATVPAWTLWLVRFQIGVPYFFAGLAKLNRDWLRGEPLRSWLAARTDVPLVGRFFTEEPVVWGMTYGALLFDLAVVPLLLHPRTRRWAFASALVFHLLNARLFSIGIFPWMMILLTTLFFPPNWPRRLLDRLRGEHGPLLILGASAGFAVGTVADWHPSLVHGVVGAVGAAALIEDALRPRRRSMPGRPLRGTPSWVPGPLLVGWVALELVPFSARVARGAGWR